MLRIDFSKLRFLVRGEQSLMRRIRRALPRWIDARQSDRLPISHRFIGIGRRARAVAAIVNSSSPIEKARAVA